MMSRVLVIDDDERIVRALAATLGDRGHDVRTATDGREGLAIAREWHPDAILCDLAMPVVDGYQVALEVTTDPTLDGCRLLAYTGHGDETRRFLAKQAGYVRYILKPAGVAELDEAIRGASG